MINWKIIFKKKWLLVSIILISAALISSTIIIVVINNQDKYPEYNDFSFNLPYISSINPEDMTTEDRLEDFYYLWFMVKENYPFLWVKERTHNFNWLDLMNVYRQKIIDCQTNIEFLEIIDNLVYSLQNIHTRLLNYELYSFLRDLGFSSYPMNYSFSTYGDEAYTYWKNYFVYLETLKNSYFDVHIVYEKGSYIVYGTEEITAKYGIINGSEVISVNSEEINSAISKSFHCDLLKVDYLRDKLYLKYLKPYHFKTNSSFTVRLNNTDILKDVSFAYGNSSEYSPPKFSPYETNQYQILDNDTAYMYIPTFSYFLQAESYTDMIAFYQDMINCSKLIIDIRDNTGGSIYYWMDNIVSPLQNSAMNFSYYMAHRNGTFTRLDLDNYLGSYTSITKESIQNLPAEVQTEAFIDELWVQEMNFPLTVDSLQFNGTIMLLIDDRVYSASDMFAAFCQETGFATVCGTKSGGDGLLWNQIYFALPNSKLVILMSKDLGMNIQGVVNEEFQTVPEVYFESNFGKWEDLVNYVKLV